MRIEQTKDLTYEIAWRGGRLALNLVPMNPGAARGNGLTFAYAAVRPDVPVLQPLADLVGISGMTLDGCPPVPRILWDSREHQFWDGFEGAFEPRNVVVSAPAVELADDGKTVTAHYYYIANTVKTTVASTFRAPTADNCRAAWDTAITVENLTGQTLRNYLQFFACYHEGGTNYYWSDDGAITPCSGGGFNGVGDAEQEGRLRASPYQTHCERYGGANRLDYFRYRQPVLLSQPRPWFGGARHVTMVQADACGGVVTWMNQARDYLIQPPGHDLEPGGSFTARVRHLIAPVDDETDLERFWSGFAADLPAS